jgi:hypothetical protein
MDAKLRSDSALLCSDSAVVRAGLVQNAALRELARLATSGIRSACKGQGYPIRLVKNGGMNVDGLSYKQQFENGWIGVRDSIGRDHVHLWLRI